MPTDFSNDDVDSVPGDDTPSSKNSEAPQVAELKARLSGKDKAIDRLKKQNMDLQEKLSDKSASTEEELSSLRVKITGFDSQLQTLTTERETERNARAAAERERDRLKLQAEAAKTIADKYPALLPDHMIGDLKLPADFGATEEYDQYLERQAAKIGATPQAPAATDNEQRTTQRPLRDTLRGATPSSSTRVVEAGNRKTRPANEIADEMMRVESGSPKYQELFQELNDATS